MAKANKQDHRGAIDDYTSTIEMKETSPDLKAMALYDRALAHVAAGNTRQGIDDLNGVLAMEDIPVNVETMTRHKLIGLESQSRKQDV